MAYRTGSAIDTADMLEQLKDFLTTANEFREIVVSGNGDGGLENYGAIDLAPSEDWVLTCTAAGPSATFSVEGSISGVQADATSESAYDNSIINFTITDGTTAWAVDDTITFLQVKNMGDENPYTDMGTRYFPQSVYDTASGDEYHPYATRTCVRVPGKHAGSYGMRLFNTSLRNMNPSMLGSTMTEGLWDSLPDVWSLTFWAQHTLTSTRSLNRVYGYSWNYKDYLSRLTFPGVYATSSKMSPDITLSINYFIVDRTITSNTEDFSNIVNYLETERTQYGTTWELFTITNDGDTVKIYKGNTLLDSSTGGERIRPFLGWIGANPEMRGVSKPYTQGRDYQAAVNDVTTTQGQTQSLYDICIWNKELTTSDIDDLLIATTPVDKEDTNLLTKIAVEDFIISNMKLVNTNSLGVSNIIDIGFTRSKGYDEINNSIRFATRPSGFIAEDLIDTTGTSDNITFSGYNQSGTSNTYYTVIPYETMGSMSKYTAARKLGESIEKFWFVADVDRIIVTYKIHDVEATSQKDPIYQSAYIGLLSDDNSTNSTLAVLGTSASPIDWESLDTSFTHGYHNQASGSIYTDEARWQTYAIDIGGSRETEIRRIGNVHQLWPIYHYLPKFNKLDSDSEQLWLEVSGYQVSMLDRQYGSPKGVYKISPYYVVAEDILSVDGDDYLIISDVWATSEGDWFAIRLK